MPTKPHELVESQIQAINRFPDQNPNPVMRIADDGVLTYANSASTDICRTVGVDVGEIVPTAFAENIRRASLSGERFEVASGERIFAVLAIHVPELGFTNLYGTDITAEKFIERFPNDNPNPVFRIDDEATLIYVNAASHALTDELGLTVGDRWPSEIAERLVAAAQSASMELIELEAGTRTYALRAVRIPPFHFINVYGTDVTAEKLVARFPSQNPNPVLRASMHGELRYANDASAPVVRELGLTVGSELPSRLWKAVSARLEAESRVPIEVTAGMSTFEFVAVPVAEFNFINLYGTDVTAARELERAKAESERLLLNILPLPIADRLRHGEQLIADRFEDATLLIADVVGFTALSGDLPAETIVRLLNDVFSTLDVLVERHGLEKVKTIGDAYMVIGGVPTARVDHLERVADMALEMTQAIEQAQSGTTHPIRCRIGINCGPIVAGVIGNKRTIYDVWGDTVNVASRMESLGAPGRVHASAAVFERLRDKFRFESRGPIEVKGKGVMNTYFLIGRRP